MTAVIIHWWNNVLGFERLNKAAARFTEGADHSAGLEVSGGNDSAQLDIVEGFHEIAARTPQYNARSVTGANHRPSFWNGGWDYSSGGDPDNFETEDADSDPVDGSGSVGEHDPTDEELLAVFEGLTTGFATVGSRVGG